MYSQKRFIFFPFIFLHLQQPAVPPLPQEGSCIGVFTALSAHVQFNVLGADGATELLKRKQILLIHTETKESVMRHLLAPGAAFTLQDVQALRSIPHSVFSFRLGYKTTFFVDQTLTMIPRM